MHVDLPSHLLVMDHNGHSAGDVFHEGVIVHSRARITILIGPILGALRRAHPGPGPHRGQPSISRPTAGTGHDFKPICTGFLNKFDSDSLFPTFIRGSIRGGIPYQKTCSRRSQISTRVGLWDVFRRSAFEQIWHI